MRDLVESLGRNMVYGNFDLWRSSPSQGAQRKTLSVFGAFFVLRDAAGKRS